jgi:hypothetical protein
MPITAANNLNKRSDKYAYMIAITIALGLMVNFALISVGKQQIGQIEVIRNEMNTSAISDANLKDLSQYVSQNQSDIKTIFNVFPNPNNESIIIALEALEALIGRYDEEAKISFSSKTTLKKNSESYIPLQISLNLARSQLISLLRDIERLPYIIEVTSINLNMERDPHNQVVIGASLYVDDLPIQP